MTAITWVFRMRPNIILITTDQQRGDCLSCDGHPVVETPYLDELAEDGARFKHAYTSLPEWTSGITAA
jgi:arylsulfatase A-like enzyme